MFFDDRHVKMEQPCLYEEIQSMNNSFILNYYCSTNQLKTSPYYDYYNQHSEIQNSELPKEAPSLNASNIQSYNQDYLYCIPRNYSWLEYSKEERCCIENGAYVNNCSQYNQIDEDGSNQYNSRNTEDEECIDETLDSQSYSDDSRGK